MYDPYRPAQKSFANDFILETILTKSTCTRFTIYNCSTSLKFYECWLFSPVCIVKAFFSTITYHCKMSIKKS